jgi:PAS domain S-box-containing protein
MSRHERELDAKLRSHQVELEHQVAERLTELTEQNEQLLAQMAERQNSEREIEERKRYLEGTLAAAPDAIVTLDAEHRIVEWNPGAERLFGYSSEETIGQNIDDLITGPEVVEEASRLTRMVLSRNQVGPMETVRYRKDGTPVDVILAGSPIVIGDELSGVVAVYTDITERKAAEKALRRRAEELEALQATMLDITAPHELSTLLQTLVERAARLLNASGGGLYLCDPDRREVRCVVSYNTPHDYTGTLLKYGEGASGTAAQTGEPLIIDDYRSWSRRAGAFEEQQPFSAVLCAPLVWKEQVTGVVVLLDDAQRRRFTEADLELLTMFANHAAIAVENARLYEQAQNEINERSQAEEALRQRTAQLEALRQMGLELTAELDLDALLRSVVSRAVELLGGTEGGLYLYRPDQDVLEWAVATNPSIPALGTVLRRGEGLSGKIWETGDPLIVDDYQRWDGRAEVYEGYSFASVVGAPVHWRATGADEELLGVINVSAGPERAFSPTDAELLGLFANQAAIAIRNTRLYEEARQRALEQEMLRETALILTTTLERDEVVQRILAQLQEVVPYDTASVQLLRNGCLEIVGCRGFPKPEEIVGITFDPEQEDNPNRKVVRNRAPHIVHDAPTVYEEFQRGPHAPARIRSWLGVPMLVGERLIGMIALDRNVPGFYTQEHARLAEAFAAQAAIAIENSRLFQAEREQRELTEALEQAAGAVSSTLELDQVLDRILEQVERVVTGDAFNVMLVENGAARVVRWRAHRTMERQYLHLTLVIANYHNLTTMVATGEPVVVLDKATDPNWVEEEGWGWVHSYIGAPIRVTGSTVGFLNVYGTRPSQFSQADGHQLQAFADHAAAAIENAQLYRTLQDHAGQLEQRVRERTAELRAQFGRLEAILRSTADGILVTDSEGQILQANPVAQAWLTQTLSPAEASLLQDTAQSLARRADQHPVELLELTGLDLELIAAPIVEPTTKVLEPDPGELDRTIHREPAAVVVIHDISHLKALDRMKTRFVSNISHELRTPITTIKLYAHLMQRQPDRWREHLSILAQEANHQVQLVEDILQISRIDAGRLEMAPQPTALDSLADIVIASHQAMANRKGLTLQHSSEEPGPVALVDPKRMTQVLNNLIENAIRYTPSGSTVTVHTFTQEAEGRVWATTTVTDTGMGIAEEDVPYVFDRFYRGSAAQSMQIPGSGLGLAIVKEIVELHGGRVTVETREGIGSTFTVWLPLSDPEPT